MEPLSIKQFFNFREADLNETLEQEEIDENKEMTAQEIESLTSILNDKEF